MPHPANTLRPIGAVLGLTFVLVTLTMTPAIASSGQAPPAHTPDAQLPPPFSPIESRASWVVKAYYTDSTQLRDLAGWREPWEVHPAEKYVVLDISAAEHQRLSQSGFRLEIDPVLTAQLYQPRTRLPGQIHGVPGYPCYRTVEETYATAQAIAADHPDLATWRDIGDSWEKTSAPARGYDLRVLRLSNSAIPGPKPKLFIMASVHAREYTPAELATRFAEHLVNQYHLDADATWLLDYHEVHLLLQANPDGRKYAENGYYWRKNTNNNYCANTLYRGADLNRNFEFQWGCCGGSSDSECEELYRGPAAASEPETQAIQDYVRAHFPDQRQDDLTAAAPVTATGILMDLHSYSQLVLWPWGFTALPAPNVTALQTLGRKFAYFNGYRPEQAAELYPTDGTTDDFAYGELGLAAYTFELGTSFFQNCSIFESKILPDNLPALIYALKVARTPYLTPSGPDTLDLRLSSTTIPLSATLHITATIDDTRFNNLNGQEAFQNIITAQFYVDTPPWISTTPTLAFPLEATDGNFDAPLEQVRGEMGTFGLKRGRHTLFVRGQDADGNWGAVSAAFFDVTSQVTVYLPVISRKYSAP